MVVLGAAAFLAAGQVLAWGKIPQPDWLSAAFWSSLDWSTVESQPWWAKQTAGYSTADGGRFQGVKQGRLSLATWTLNSRFSLALDGTGVRRAELWSAADNGGLCRTLLGAAAGAFGRPRYRDGDNFVVGHAVIRDYQWAVGNTVVEMRCIGDSSRWSGSLSFGPSSDPKLKVLEPLIWMACKPDKPVGYSRKGAAFVLRVDRTAGWVWNEKGQITDDAAQITGSAVRYTSDGYGDTPRGRVEIDRAGETYRAMDDSGREVERGVCVEEIRPMADL